MNDYGSVIEEIGCMQPLSLTAICGTHENCLEFAIFKNDESRTHHKKILQSITERVHILCNQHFLQLLTYIPNTFHKQIAHIIVATCYYGIVL